MTHSPVGAAVEAAAEAAFMVAAVAGRFTAAAVEDSMVAACTPVAFMPDGFTVVIAVVRARHTPSRVARVDPDIPSPVVRVAPVIR